MNTTSLSIKTGNGKGLTLTNYNDGKIHGWNGGNCPVHPKTLVKVFQKGILSSLDYKADNLHWGHCDNCGDIVAFQVVKEYKEPMVVWVNVYKNGFGSIYKTEKEALSAAVYAVGGVTVKFIEVK